MENGDQYTSVVIIVDTGDPVEIRSWTEHTQYGTSFKQLKAIMLLTASEGWKWKRQHIFDRNTEHLKQLNFQVSLG